MLSGFGNGPRQWQNPCDVLLIEILLFDHPEIAKERWSFDFTGKPNGSLGPILAAGSRPRERPESGTQAPSDKQQAGVGDRSPPETDH